MMMRFVGWAALGLVALGLDARGSGVPPGAETPAVRKGLAYLEGQSGGSVGEQALAALAMTKCGRPASDARLAVCLKALLARFTSDGYSPGGASDQDLYEASCTAMALANIDPKAYKSQLQFVATYIANRQSSNGCFDYPSRSELGDTSVTQYSLLGLWEAVEQGEAVISPAVWDKCARWLISSQQGDGSHVYRPETPMHQGGPTLSMTSAAAGGLLICRSELVPYFRTTAVIVNPLLTPIETETRKYLATVTPGAIDSAVTKANSWMASHFSATANHTMGETPYYGLYGIERVGALSGLKKLGSHDWFEEGRKFVESNQGADGSWNSKYGQVPNTSWAILFLIRANALTVKKIQAKLAAGTLLGGRGLPKNLADLTVAGGRIVVRPMNGAVDGMLKVLEDPKAEDADAALAGLLNEYEKGGARVLKPLKDRFRKMLGDKDQGLRRVAAWALARTGDLDVVPSLIQVLGDSDPEVMVEARNGLQLLFRRVDSPGPAVGATPDQIKVAMAKWREWYNAIRPADQAAAVENGPAAAAPAAPAPASSSASATR